MKSWQSTTPLPPPGAGHQPLNGKHHLRLLSLSKGAPSSGTRSTGQTWPLPGGGGELMPHE